MKKSLYIGLGTNLGNKAENIKKAIVSLSNKLGQFTALSSIYQSEPWGFESDDQFFNLVIEFKTDFKPLKVLSITQEIEKELGRLPKKGDSYESRIIDIDILLFEDQILQTKELTIPHQNIAIRRFVLEPLLEICQNDKILETYQPSLNECKKGQSIKKITNSELF